MPYWNIKIKNASGSCKEIKVKAATAELAVRQEMCWYNYDTVFEITAADGTICKFKKVSNNKTGHADLIAI